MKQARTTEEFLRGEDYTFACTQLQGTVDRDIYISDDKIELCVDYDPDGCPTGVVLRSPAYGIDALTVFDETGGKLSEEQIEILVYELLDDQPRIIERLTGLTADEEDEEPACV